MNCARALAIATALMLSSGGMQATAAPMELLPNLRALPAYDIYIEVDVLGRPMLRFTATTWNSGAGPLEVRAGETGTDRKGNYRQNIYQRIYLDDGTFYDRLAGAFVWHPEHHHFHVDDYALYTLQLHGGKGKSKVDGSKTSFCLTDSLQIDGSLPGAPRNAIYTACDNVYQGISVGWGDEYGAFLPGQNLDLSGLPSGEYDLAIEVDAKNRLTESIENDNTSCVLLDIDMTALTVDVLNATSCDDTTTPPSGAPTIAAIDPDSGSKGTIVPVTITGSGFTDGMAVSFENGSGPSPVASDIVVVDANTITANVTIKSGGKGGSVWDLRVDSAVLPAAFSVLR